MKTAKELFESHNEGSTAVKNLCRLCRAIGYKDQLRFGAFDHDGSYGDLIEFLEDNSGAVEAIKEFIAEYFADQLEDEDEDEDEYGTCLMCHTELGVVDDDPNGEHNPDCARCRAESEHDFDVEPNAKFDRSGNRID